MDFSVHLKRAGIVFRRGEKKIDSRIVDALVALTKTPGQKGFFLDREFPNTSEWVGFEDKGFDRRYGGLFVVVRSKGYGRGMCLSMLEEKYPEARDYIRKLNHEAHKYFPKR